jgi:hypothetical protein
MNTIEKEKHEKRVEAINLLNDIKKGATIHGIVRGVSSSGMSRTISFHMADIDFNDEPYIRGLTYSIAGLLGYKVISVNGHDAIRVNGCGMDMVFKVVYDLGVVLFGDGYALKSSQL